ncbi:type IV toxin-antitoxin system AbiEi family antitoxin domain-containing protein [Nocardioides limicola]|uniref:type IV toxin-antitoxin system AbiEi family antitoxin domain-containing protein n=1 Tax=Nocardioides limicola TaxID=2803368 RepID=UPI00193C5FE5|nr:type IV toxin-antitoxin system AbiEi family antitoxin domain-containing protein [Nocardioides sp. DJM-14]
MVSTSTHSRAIDVQLRRDLVATGLDDKAIRGLLRSGVLHRVRRGAYVDAASWRELGGHAQYATVCHAVYQQAKSELVLSHVSAANEYGAPLLRADLTQVHATRLDERGGRREGGVVQHRGLLLAEDIVEIEGRRITSPTRTCLDVTTVMDPESALGVVNHLLHEGLTTLDELRARYQRGETMISAGGERLTAMAHWPATLTTEHVLAMADARCESLAESRAIYLFWRAGLPIPIPQFEVRDQDGRLVGRVDFAWPDHGVFLEVDGKVKYTTYVAPGETAADAVIREKRREERIVELTGWRCIRITWSDLESPVRTIERLRRALALGPRD